MVLRVHWGLEGHIMLIPTKDLLSITAEENFQNGNHVGFYRIPEHLLLDPRHKNCPYAYLDTEIRAKMERKITPLAAFISCDDDTSLVIVCHDGLAEMHFSFLKENLTNYDLNENAEVQVIYFEKIIHVTYVCFLDLAVFMERWPCGSQRNTRVQACRSQTQRVEK
jgi:hypothetical protein